MTIEDIFGFVAVNVGIFSTTRFIFLPINCFINEIIIGKKEKNLSITEIITKL
jgi:hypothetical protein